MATKVANIMGPTGPHGTPAWTITSGSFTVPPIGGTVTVTVNDPTWIAVNEVVWVMGANGSGQAGQLRVQSIAGNNVTLINSPNTPAAGDMLKSIYDTNNDTIVDHAALADTANAAPWTGITGKPASYPPSPYYAADTTNTNAYAITVGSDFRLVSGAVVWFVLTNQNTGAPTLNVNGTGAMPLTNRAGITLMVGEVLARGRTYGAVYDGANWRIFTKLSRYYTGNNPGNITIECAGFDAVSVTVIFTVSTSSAVTLAHVEPGQEISIEFNNGYSTALSYSINPTALDGTTINAYWIWANATTGASAIILNSAQTVGAGLNFFCKGTFHGQIGLCLL